MDTKDLPALPTAASGPASGAAAMPASAASTVADGLPLIRADAESPYSSLVSTVLTVALVGVAVIWALRRSGWTKQRSTQASLRMLQIRETVHVAPKVRVTYLRCGTHELVLAHSEHSQAWLTLPPSGGAPPTPSPQDPRHDT